MAVPAVGAKAPGIHACRATAAARVSLADFKGRKLVLYFYPKADTPGCTKEAIAFSGPQARLCQGRTPTSSAFRPIPSRRRTNSATSTA